MVYLFILGQYQTVLIAVALKQVLRSGKLIFNVYNFLILEWVAWAIWKLSLHILWNLGECMLLTFSILFLRKKTYVSGWVCFPNYQTLYRLVFFREKTFGKIKPWLSCLDNMKFHFSIFFIKKKSAVLSFVQYNQPNNYISQFSIKIELVLWYISRKNFAPFFFTLPFLLKILSWSLEYWAIMFLQWLKLYLENSDMRMNITS